MLTFPFHRCVEPFMCSNAQFPMRPWCCVKAYRRLDRNCIPAVFDIDSSCIRCNIYQEKSLQHVDLRRTHQHPVPLLLEWFSLQSASDGLSQLWDKGLHNQVCQDLSGHVDTNPPTLRMSSEPSDSCFISVLLGDKH